MYAMVMIFGGGGPDVRRQEQMSYVLDQMHDGELQYFR